MLSRFGPRGLSVLALAASFVIVFTAGGVLAAAGVGTGRQAPTPTPTPPTRPPATAPADPNFIDVAIDVDDLAGGETLRSVDGVTFRLRTVPGAGAEMSGGGVQRTLLCATLPDDWTLPSATLRHWSLYDGDHCRPVQPGAKIRVRLERVR
jgi:hypothetical protein